MAIGLFKRMPHKIKIQIIVTIVYLFVLSYSLNTIELQRFKKQKKLGAQSITGSKVAKGPDTTVLNAQNYYSIGQSQDSQFYILKNYKNMQYYGQMGFGGPNPQKFSILFDTGSQKLWIPARNCSNCPSHVKKYKWEESIYYQPMYKRQQIKYGKGATQGFLTQDLISFEKLEVEGMVMLADYEKDHQSMKADGILGLNNMQNYTNIFEKGYSDGKLVSSLFAFRLGNQNFGQKSYFYYNFTQDQQLFKDAYYINASRSYYWNIPISYVMIGESRATAKFTKQALLDTGTSLLILPPTLFAEFFDNNLAEKCKPFFNIQYNCQCDRNLYPNITMVTQGISFNITPSMYLLGPQTGSYCVLAVDKLEGLNFIILGDIFLTTQTVIFDKENNRVGFVDNHFALINYLQAGWINVLLNIIQGCTIILAGLLMFWPRKKNVNGLYGQGIVLGSSVRQQMSVPWNNDSRV